MPSTYSTNLKITLQATGENSDTWGDITNTNFNVLDSVLSQVLPVSLSGGDVTLTPSSGAIGTNDSRYNLIKITTSKSDASSKLILPTASRTYVIFNNTSYFISVGAGSSFVSVPNGTTMSIYCDGTNFSSAVTAVPSLVSTSTIKAFNGWLEAGTAKGAWALQTYTSTSNISDNNNSGITFDSSGNAILWLSPNNGYSTTSAQIYKDSSNLVINSKSGVTALTADNTGNVTFPNLTTFSNSVAFNGSSVAFNGGITTMPHYNVDTQGTATVTGGYTNSIYRVTNTDTYTGGGSGYRQGNIYYTGYPGSNWVTTSDESVKDIIEPISGATEKVSQLRTVMGRYKSEDANARHPFLIAQDVQQVLPEVISSVDGVLGLDYTGTIPLLVAAIKELTERVKMLEGK